MSYIPLHYTITLFCLLVSFTTKMSKLLWFVFPVFYLLSHQIRISYSKYLWLSWCPFFHHSHNQSKWYWNSTRMRNILYFFLCFMDCLAREFITQVAILLVMTLFILKLILRKQFWTGLLPEPYLSFWRLCEQSTYLDYRADRAFQNSDSTPCVCEPSWNKLRTWFGL